MPIVSTLPNLHLRLLGPPSQTIDGNEVTGFRSAKTKGLLYYLAVTGVTHRRATLAALFWPNVSEKSARSSLRGALSSLQTLIPGAIDIERYSVAIDPDRVWLDTRQFTSMLQETGDPSLAIQQHLAAVSLYAGDFLEGFYIDDAPDFDLWVTTTREHFHHVMIQVLTDLARGYMIGGDPTASLAVLSRLLTMTPGNEAAHRLMMQVLANTGQRAAAMQQFHICRRYLTEELGVDPAPETATLYAQLLEGTGGRWVKRPADARAGSRALSSGG